MSENLEEMHVRDFEAGLADQLAENHPVTLSIMGQKILDRLKLESAETTVTLQ